jgi:hypothetical protein
MEYKDRYRKKYKIDNIDRKPYNLNIFNIWRENMGKFLYFLLLAICLVVWIGWSNLGNDFFSGVGAFGFIFFSFLGVLFYLWRKKDGEEFDEHMVLATPYLKKLLNKVIDFKNSNEFNEKKCLEAENSEDYSTELWWVNDNNLISIKNDEWYQESVEDRKNERYSNFIKEKKNHFPLFERKINIDKIKYYKVDGQKRYETKIKGGGSSLGGAIVGGAIAGDVGAIIGSRKKIESEEVEHDERNIVLVYEKNEKLLKEKFVYSDYFEVFEQLIPEKNYEYLLLQTSNKGKRKSKR